MTAKPAPIPMNTITLPRSVVEQTLEHLTCAIDAPVREALRAALEQPQDHPEQRLDMVPAGWKLVPVKLTQEMLAAGRDAHYKAENRIQEPGSWEPGGFAKRAVRAAHVFQAMLAAAPKPPVVEQPQGEQEPIAYEFYNPATGHAIVDYSEHTHVGHLTAAKGYIAKPLFFHPQPKRELRSEQEIVDQTEKLAELFMTLFQQRVKEDSSTTMRGSSDMRAQHCWTVACRVQEMLTQTDPENAAAELDRGNA